MKFFLFLTISVHLTAIPAQKRTPFVISTWGFSDSAIKAWDLISSEGKSAITAIVEGIAVCESNCGGSVGPFDSPNENGETTLDAMIMDGKTMKCGSVAGLREVKDAIAVARHVMDYTQHTLLVGDQATEFAIKMGFERQNISIERRQEFFDGRKSTNCQPNYWMNVLPDPRTSCGPYDKVILDENRGNLAAGRQVDVENHDTIGMVAIDKNGNIAAGTSTNGLRFKIPGRVGDSPIPGAGAYAENGIGGAAATGDGDVMMLFSPTFLAVEFLRNGRTAQEAADLVIDRIFKYYPKNSAALVVTDMDGNYGAACQTFGSFPFTIYHPGLNEVKVESVRCRQEGDELTTKEVVAPTTPAPDSGHKSSVNCFLIVALVAFTCSTCC